MGAAGVPAIVYFPTGVYLGVRGKVKVFIFRLILTPNNKILRVVYSVRR